VWISTFQPLPRRNYQRCGKGDSVREQQHYYSIGRWRARIRIAARIIWSYWSHEAPRACWTARTKRSNRSNRFAGTFSGRNRSHRLRVNREAWLDSIRIRELANARHLTELFGEIVRVQVDLTNASQVRVYTQIGDNYGPPDSIIYCQYSLDGGTTWAALTDAAVITSTGPHVAVWMPVPSGARRDVLVRPVSIHGIDGDVDIEAAHLQVR